ncbi:MAG TPA: adenylate/guanylate cyclase domain-containing protein [Pseudomonadota bacterium]|nr:adenylate/guanylate cyclase domain-containing protein [Pseudomonadota bacterium]
MAKLIVLTGSSRKEFELGEFNTIGRHPENSIQILDRIVSKEHAHIIRQPDGSFMLKDLGSLNGSYIGNVRITEQILKNNDEITMGNTRMMYTERGPNEDSLQRVTIANSTLNDSHIRHKVDADRSERFMPAKDLPVDTLKRDYEKLRIAHELGQAIMGILDLETLLPKILDKSFELLPADRGVILLMENGQLQPKYVKYKNAKLAHEQIQISNAILNEVTQNKRAVLSSDASMDVRFVHSQSIILQGIRSTMSVPLMHGSELLGVMHLDSQIAANAFTERDLQLFNSIANQAAIAIQNARLTKKIEEEAKTRAQFQRLLSPKLVEQLVSGKLHLEKGGELREVTMLFSDIRGFTAMTERHKATEIVAMLNEYFEVMIEILFKYNGTLDKYVGDEIMALFGAPVPVEEATWCAVQCAIEMQTALQHFNSKRTPKGFEPIDIGIGINIGSVVCGMIGSSHTMQYTVIGDAVNTASRLCSVAGKGEIIVSEQALQAVSDRVEYVALPPTKVKGKLQALRIFNVLGRKGDATGFFTRDLTTPG